MSIKLTVATLALAVSLPALATAGPGSDQLAKIAGVPTGQYTDTELVQIDAARKSQDTEYLSFVLNHGAGNEVSSTSTGAIMQSNLLGVAPGSLSVADLTILDDAISQNDETRVAFQLAKVSPSVGRSETADPVNAGHLQIAKQAGVNPNLLSTGDLNRLIIAQREGDNELVRFLLNN